MAQVSDWMKEQFWAHKKTIIFPAGLVVTLSTARLYMRWRIYKERALQRPYVIKDLTNEDLRHREEVEDPQGEMAKVVTWLQDAVSRPIDARLPGKPFEHDLLSFPFTPMVLVVGNHSAGKSTFINGLLGRQMQETGVAPTDDGFTVLERSRTGTDEVEDGPTLLSCPQNRPFKELQRFGQPFWGHFRRKRLVLPSETQFPYGLQIIDTPGMIDMPVQSGLMAGGRGYNFIEVVRWFAKRADLILLLFDPDRPGTTGESLDVLTRSLTGLDHKFVIVLNKVDQLDSSVDFARAYGTLGWALSKVIPRKDIPLIYTMYNDVEEGDEKTPARKEHKLPLEAFRKKRREVVAEVLRSRGRHWDNVITSTEDMLRQMQMVASVTSAVRAKVKAQREEAMMWAGAAMGLPAIVASWLLEGKWKQKQFMLPIGFWASYGVVAYGLYQLLQAYSQQFERLQVTNLDQYFEEVYAWYFIHADAEDLRVRWATVRPRVASILRAAAGTVSTLPEIPQWEIDRIDECLEKDIWYMRLLAKLVRGMDKSEPTSLPDAGEIGNSQPVRPRNGKP